MKSSNKAVRDAFTSVINALGYQTYPNGTTIDAYPYVILGEQTEVQAGDQGSFGQITTINIMVVDGWAKYGDRTRGDAMTDAITQAILTKPHSLQIAGFDMPSLVLDNIMTSTEKTSTHTIQTTVMRFKMQLFQKWGSAFDYKLNFQFQ
jgi:hypothetical protein